MFAQRKAVPLAPRADVDAVAAIADLLAENGRADLVGTVLGLFADAEGFRTFALAG